MTTRHPSRAPRVALSSRTPHPAVRSGIALVATIAAITLVGILALASARLARGRMVGARRVTAVHDASLAAARLLDSAAASSRAADWARVAIGARAVLRDDARERLVLHRAGESLFRLDVALQRGDAIAPVRHAASLLVRADAARLDRGAPLVAGGAVDVARDFIVVAAADPSCARAAATAEVVAADTSLVRWEDAAAAGRAAEDPSLRAPSWLDRAAARIRAAAELELPPGARWSPAADTLAVVAALGDLTLGPGRGRGALLVLGDLTVAGPLDFTGSILVLGRTTTIGSGVALIGTLSSRGDAELRGGSLRHDACAAADAAMRAARLKPVHVWGYGVMP
jgi:hypothetical protein